MLTLASYLAFPCLNFFKMGIITVPHRVVVNIKSVDNFLKYLEACLMYIVCIYMCVCLIKNPNFISLQEKFAHRL